MFSAIAENNFRSINRSGMASRQCHNLVSLARFIVARLAANPLLDCPVGIAGKGKTAAVTTAAAPTHWNSPVTAI
jgi:hypothetical protein